MPVMENGPLGSQNHIAKTVTEGWCGVIQPLGGERKSYGWEHRVRHRCCYSLAWQ